MLKAALQPGGPLHALATYKQFILCRKKLPVNPHTLQVCNAHDPAIWVSGDEAVAMAESLSGYDVGFVFTADDPFYFLDIDNALQADNTWSSTAQELLAALPGAAVEVSQSGRGLHIFGTTRDPFPVHNNKNISLSIELYTSKRYVYLTGTNAIGDAAVDSTLALSTVISQYFTPSGAESTLLEWSDTPVPEWNGPGADSDLITKALAATSAASIFGNRATFADLWEAREEALATAYPSQDVTRPYDYSSADAGLVQHLAFWTGKDCARIERIMRQSALVRDKWDREDYIHRTILRAVSIQEGVYNSGHKALNVPVTPDLTNIPGIRIGLQIQPVSLQAKHFEGCVYVEEMKAIFHPNAKNLYRDQEQFKIKYGGYLYSIDSYSTKTIKDAWEIFTKSQAINFLKVDASVYMPSEPVGKILEIEGHTYVNVYVPAKVRKIAGDPTPFLNHLAKLLPVVTDRDIFLAYLAALIQHVGVKFQWAPLLQGVEGNGKTLFTMCIEAALGKNHCARPSAAELDNKFNSWIHNKTFIGIEDIWVPDHRRSLLEVLKPMITSNRFEIQYKGKDQFTSHICANFLLNSNHQDAIRKTRNDRRFAVFFTAQQQSGDLARDGMEGPYFYRLYKWLEADGYAIVAHYLTHYPIPEALNPATQCLRAPRTSSTQVAIAASLGGVEQEILEAIAAGKHGFCGGWVSSDALNRLLESTHMAKLVPRNKRRALMEGLGYEHHPALPDGRLNNPLGEDLGKPILFINNECAGRYLQPDKIGEAFKLAQSIIT